MSERYVFEDSHFEARVKVGDHVLYIALGFVILACPGLFVSCSIFNPEDDTSMFSGPWLLPEAEVVDGGPGLDGIPSIEEPDLAAVSEIDFVPDQRMVIGVDIYGEIRAYPHQILDWHEIINDKAGDHYFSLVFCPLTGTGMSWNRNVNDEITEFGVSGLLFRNNLIAYDRNTHSAWSQMQLRSVNGELKEMNIETYPVLETTWRTWKTLYPDSKVHTTNTGHQRNYRGYTYGRDYATNHDKILFPLIIRDNRLQIKERVLGIIDSETADMFATVKVFVIDRFGGGVNLIKNRVGDHDYLIVGSSEFNFATAFKPEPEHRSLRFQVVQDQLPVVLKDDEGNLWDIFGYATKGPREGERMLHAQSYIGYWFAWADFFPGVEIYDHKQESG